MPRTKVSVPDVAEVPPGLWSNAIRAGDMLFISGGARTCVIRRRVPTPIGTIFDPHDIGGVMLRRRFIRYRFGSTSETIMMTASAGANFGTSSTIAFHSGVAATVFRTSGLSNQSSVTI
jgi:hypothetical protein